MKAATGVYSYTVMKAPQVGSYIPTDTNLLRYQYHAVISYLLIIRNTLQFSSFVPCITNRAQESTRPIMHSFMTQVGT